MFPKIGSFVVNGPQGAPWVERRLIVLNALDMWGTTTGQLYGLLQPSREVIPSLPILAATLANLEEQKMVMVRVSVDQFKPKFWEITGLGREYLVKARQEGWTPLLRVTMREALARA